MTYIIGQGFRKSREWVKVRTSTLGREDALDLRFLGLYVCRKIYEPENMKAYEVKQMEESLMVWDRHCRFTLNDEIWEVVKKYCKLLVDDESGKFNARKALYKQHKIDWRKVERIPGAFNRKDLNKAQGDYQKWLTQNPEFKNRHERRRAAKAAYN